MNISDINQVQKVLDFQGLLNPFTPEHFVKEYWEKELLFVERNNPDFYKSLFSIDQVDHILDSSRPKGKDIRVVKNQEPLLSSKYEKADGSLNLNQLYTAYADGYTVVINEIERFWNPLKSFCRNMSSFLSHHTVANMYLTPKNQKALLPHYDTHDVYVLQIHGKKHWKLYDSPLETPLLNSYQPIFKREQLRNVKEVTLKAGDLMYMPRGLPHEAYTTDESSLHITIGVYPSQWVDLLTNSIIQLANKNPKLRKALPVGYLNEKNITPDFINDFKATFGELLSEVSNQASANFAINVLSQELKHVQTPCADGHFRQLDKIDTINLETRLSKRKDMECIVRTVGNVTRLIFPGNVIKGPVHVSKSFEFIANSKGGFILNDLPNISDGNKVKLAARLVRGGILQFED